MQSKLKIDYFVTKRYLNKLMLLEHQINDLKEKYVVNFTIQNAITLHLILVEVESICQMPLEVEESDPAMTTQLIADRVLNL